MNSVKSIRSAALGLLILFSGLGSWAQESESIQHYSIQQPATINPALAGVGLTRLLATADLASAGHSY